jgi:hypothetical protein
MPQMSADIAIATITTTAIGVTFFGEDYSNGVNVIMWKMWKSLHAEAIAQAGDNEVMRPYGKEGAAYALSHRLSLSLYALISPRYVFYCELCVLSRRSGPDATVWTGLDKCGKEKLTSPRSFLYKV